MSETRVTIDPDGDTLVILVIKQGLPPPSSTEPADAVNSTCPADTPESPEFIEKHFLCSKKHLTLASRRASKLFSSAFKEASKQDDGLYHWNFGDVFDAEAFELALKIIHGKTRGVPQTPKLHVLAKIASVVDDLECHDAISFFSERWLATYDFFYTLPHRMDETLAQLILISFVFSDKKLFSRSTEEAIRYTSEGMPTFDLPIRADIPSRIEQSRTAILQYLVDGLYNLQNDILEGKPNSPAGNHSDSWLLHVRSPSPAAPRSNAATTQSTSSLFGSRVAAITTPTSGPGGMFGSSNAAQNTATSGTASNGLFSGNTGFRNNTPRPASGGLFGASATSAPSAASGSGSVTTTAPQNTTTTKTTSLFGQRLDPQSDDVSGSATFPSAGSMFGSIASSRASSTPRTSGPSTSTAIKQEEAPQMLVRHSCCLKDFIDPIILGAESKIQGLKLADFPQP
ncbi:hypothetical protein NW762_006233 [Fusarium torreyae]|uniref:BTB domain-containing protein n=1 Tax=Fusarium torreyae TaxID=1237075 RepID=A0A9W8S063_9HYPO|nr:hypothetical protein NW762_006233 [Fusarium torreyae]